MTMNKVCCSLFFLFFLLLFIPLTSGYSVGISPSTLKIQGHAHETVQAQFLIANPSESAIAYLISCQSSCDSITFDPQGTIPPQSSSLIPLSVTIPEQEQTLLLTVTSSSYSSPDAVSFQLGSILTLHLVPEVHEKNLVQDFLAEEISSPEKKKNTLLLTILLVVGTFLVSGYVLYRV